MVPAPREARGRAGFAPTSPQHPLATEKAGIRPSVFIDDGRDVDVALARAVLGEALEGLGRLGDATRERATALGALRSAKGHAPAGPLVHVLLLDAKAWEKRGDATHGLSVATEAADVAVAASKKDACFLVVEALRRVASLQDSLGKGDEAAATLERALAGAVVLLGKPELRGGDDDAGKKRTLDERFGVQGTMLKRPPAECNAVGDLFFARALIAEESKDRRRALFYYENALLLLKQARGDSPFIARLTADVAKLRADVDAAASKVQKLRRRNSPDRAASAVKPAAHPPKPPVRHSAPAQPKPAMKHTPSYLQEKTLLRRQTASGRSL